MGEHFIFIICFLKVQLYLCIYLFLHSSIYIFLSYYFSALNVFQGFSFSFAENFRTRSWQVVEWFKGYFTRAVYFWKAKLELVSRQHNFPTKPKVKFLTFSRHGQNWTVLYFFHKSELLTIKNRVLNIPLGLNEIYAVWTVHWLQAA